VYLYFIENTILIAIQAPNKTGKSDFLYYYSGTPASGSADPLSLTVEVRSLLRTGWGPRGDSGSARGRVRATQPANFFCFPQSFDAERIAGGPNLGPPLFLCRPALVLHPTVGQCRDLILRGFANEWVEHGHGMQTAGLE
jgi:hypothetical protein